MNQDQMLSALRWALAAAGPYVIGSGYFSGNTWAQVTTAAVTLAPLVWGLFVHTNANTVKAAVPLTGGVPIAIGPSAPAAVKELAADSSVPNVVPALPVPSPYATSSQRK